MVSRATQKTLDSAESSQLYYGEAIKSLYYHLYTNSNLPRAERLSAEFIRLLFCKIYCERTGNATFSELEQLSDDDAKRRLEALFEKVRVEYRDIFDAKDHVYLDARSTKAVAQLLSKINFSSVRQDVIAESIQTFLGSQVRGEKGQFFTPRSAADATIEILSPALGERFLDPACGSGTFLALAFKCMVARAGRGGTSFPEIRKNIYGIDKEFDLAKISKAYLSLMGDGDTAVFCFDSLDRRTWDARFAEVARQGFHVIATNPPFGTRIKVTSGETLREYSLGHRWELSKSSKKWEPTSDILPNQDPQILFVDLCVQLLAPGGRLGIVLPEGVLASKQYGYVVDFLRAHGRIFAIIDCPRVLFQPSTDIKTVILFFQKTPADGSGHIFMAEVRECGHDRRGRPKFLPTGKLLDEFPSVPPRFSNPTSPDRLGFRVRESQIDPYYLLPRYYNLETENTLQDLARKARITPLTIGDLVKQKVISISRGIEPGSRSYTLEGVPFIRTSDIANWEISKSPTKFVSEEAFAEYKDRVVVRQGDILFVNDGRYRIGNCCMVTEFDTTILVQSHIRIIHVNRPDELDPYLLLFLLRSDLVQAQVQRKTSVQSTIATLGGRLKEVVLPIPRSEDKRRQIAERMRRLVEGRARLLNEEEQITHVFEVQ